MDYNFNQQDNNSPKKSGGRGVSVAIAVMCVMVCIVLCCVCFVLGTSMNNETASISQSDSGSENSSSQGSETSATTEAEQTAATVKDAPEKVVLDGAFSVTQVTSGNEYKYKEIAALTENSVVEITTSTKKSNGSYVTSGAGSGVIITSDGYIVTNNHVIEGAAYISVRLPDGEKYTATLIGTDAETDIAVIKIDATGLTAATFGDSSKLVKGDVVVAIGNPLGTLGGTVTEGIISALERSITIDGETMTLLQTSAAINPGNSGGGLFNSAGELIGIVNAKSSGTGIEGLGFAIPVNTAIPIIEDIMNYGFVRGRVMMGIKMLDIYDRYTQSIYSFYDFYVSEAGTYIYSVESGSDAEKAGLKKYDRIVSINGTEVTSASVVNKLVEKCSVGDTVTLVIKRDGNEMTIQITFTEYIPEGAKIPVVSG